MKTFSILLLSSATIFSACGNNNTTDQAGNTGSDSLQTLDSNPPSEAAPVRDLVADYLELKNALATDNSNDAAAAAKKINETLSKVDASAFTEDQRKIYGDVKDDLIEHAEHIASNGSNIAHQREHFDMVSQDMIDLVKVTGTGQTLYQEFCPMYNNKKGASWLSESREIKNPYYGKEMQECGEVKEVFKPKEG